MKLSIINFGLVFLLIAVSAAFAGDIIPVKDWPKSIVAGGKLITGPTVTECIEAGYRLLPDKKPSTPAGKKIVSEKIIQDPADPAKCKYEIVYADAVTVKPTATTNIPADRVLFTFSTNGHFRGVVWLDAPVTNAAKEK